MKDDRATLYLLRATGITNNRCVVFPLSQKYLSTTLVRKTNPKCMCHFVFFLSIQLQVSVSKMPWKVQYPVIFIFS